MAKPHIEVVLDCLAPQRLEAFWRAALGYRSLFSDEDIVVLVPDNDVGSPLLLQPVAETKHGNNRMHVDIIKDDVEAEVTRLEALGARRLHEGVQVMGPVSWVT